MEKLRQCELDESMIPRNNERGRSKNAKAKKKKDKDKDDDKDKKEEKSKKKKKRKGPKCYACNKWGHLSYDCPENDEESGNNRRNINARSSDRNSN